MFGRIRAQWRLPSSVPGRASKHVSRTRCSALAVHRRCGIAKTRARAIPGLQRTTALRYVLCGARDTGTHAKSARETGAGRAAVSLFPYPQKGNGAPGGARSLRGSFGGGLSDLRRAPRRTSSRRDGGEPVSGGARVPCDRDPAPPGAPSVPRRGPYEPADRRSHLYPVVGI